MQAICAILGDYRSSTKEGDFYRSAPDLSVHGRGQYDLGVATVLAFGHIGFIHCGK